MKSVVPSGDEVLVVLALSTALEVLIEAGLKVSHRPLNSARNFRGKPPISPTLPKVSQVFHPSVVHHEGGHRGCHVVSFGDQPRKPVIMGMSVVGRH